MTSATRVTLIARTSNDKRHPLGEHTLLIGQLMALLNRARGTPLGPELTARLASGLDGFTRPQLDALTGFLRDTKGGPVRVLDFTTRQPIERSTDDDWGRDEDEDEGVEFVYDPAAGTLRGHAGDRDLFPDSAIVSVSVQDGARSVVSDCGDVRTFTTKTRDLT
jgi:hypothetical protein